MKKTALFVAVIAALSLASCKKDRTCTCTTVESDGTNSTTSTQVYTVKDAKKGDAKKMCIDQTSSNTTTFGGMSVTYTQTRTCELK